MVEYDIIYKMIRSNFQSERQDIMVEKKGNLGPHIVRLNTAGCKNMPQTLYRFNLDDEDFLPFFKEPKDAPEGLRKFCDYILLVEKNGSTYIILIEMKRNKDDVAKAKKQLNASETFMQYIINSAERLKRDFRIDFNSEQIIWRKVICVECTSIKEEIKGRKDIDTRNEFITYKSNGSFSILPFL